MFVSADKILFKLYPKDSSLLSVTYTTNPIEKIHPRSLDRERLSSAWRGDRIVELLNGISGVHMKLKECSYTSLGKHFGIISVIISLWFKFQLMENLEVVNELVICFSTTFSTIIE